MENHNPQQHPPNVQCYVCGRKFLTETANITEENAVQNGWVKKDNHLFCKFCAMPRHPIHTPYVIKDDRYPFKNGTFIDVVGSDTAIRTYKLNIKDCVPTWELFPYPSHY